MKYAAYLLVAVALVTSATVAGSDAPPKPSIVPVSWQLGFEYKPIESIRLTPPGASVLRTYWYMLFTVTNKTGVDQIYVPDFVLSTDTGKVSRAGTNVPTSVFRAILKRHNNPLLTSPPEITGKILQGEDNAKDGVAIWENFDPKARKFDVFIGGLSGERAVIQLPTPVTVVEKDDEGKPRKVTKDRLILAKSLHLAYGIPGESAARTKTRPKLLKSKWVMR